MSIMQITQTIQIMPPMQMKRSKRPAQPMLPGLELPQSAPPKVTNRQIAEVLAGIADMIANQNGNPYRMQAYRNAARGILDLQEPAADIIARGEPLNIPGLGSRLRQRITELVQCGSMTINNGLYQQSLPPGVKTLLTLEHIGPYTAIRLHEELGIDSVEKLLEAAEHQMIRHLPGFGIRSEARLKMVAENILHHKKKQSRTGGAA